MMCSKLLGSKVDDQKCMDLPSGGFTKGRMLPMALVPQYLWFYWIIPKANHVF